MRLRPVGAVAAGAMVALALTMQPTSVAAQSGAVEVKLTLYGDVPIGEIHRLHFDPGHVGVTDFVICGGSDSEPCTRGTYSGRYGGLDRGAAFGFRFERIAPDGSVSVYYRGTGVVGEVTLVTAVFRYGTLPNTATSMESVPAVALPLVVSLVAAVPLLLVMRRRPRRT